MQVRSDRSRATQETWQNVEAMQNAAVCQKIAISVLLLRCARHTSAQALGAPPAAVARAQHKDNIMRHATHVTNSRVTAASLRDRELLQSALVRDALVCITVLAHGGRKREHGRGRQSRRELVHGRHELPR